MRNDQDGYSVKINNGHASQKPPHFGREEEVEEYITQEAKKVRKILDAINDKKALMLAKGWREIGINNMT